MYTSLWMNGGRRSVGEMRKEDELRVWSSSEIGNASEGLFLFGGGKARRGSVAKGFGCRQVRQGSGAAHKMVLKTEVCRFSGSKIYPGRGIRFIRSDSQVFLFLNSKCKRYFHNRLKPSKLTWTALFRKQHKKDAHAETIKKKRRASNKPYSRSIVGASLEVIQKKRTEKTEVRAAAREAALREIKERIKKTKDEKKAKKVEVASKPKPGKAVTRAPQAKPAKTGAGGKR